MPDYKAPLRDIKFVMNELLNSEQHYANLEGAEDATPDMVDAIIAEGAKFCEQVLSPLNQVGDKEGCTWSEDGVKTPTGFKEAYQQYVEGGWPSMNADPNYGGQGLPGSLGIVMSEMVGTANWSFGMYPGLSHGATNTIEEHGTEEQKQKYVPRLATGEVISSFWLTEPDVGSDAASLKTRADKDGDHYILNGTKRYITNGPEAGLYTVMARTDQNNKGAGGITAFIVEGDTPGISRGKADVKMGQKGAHTCDIIFDNCRVPAENIIGGKEGVGFKTAMKVLDRGRLHISAICVGVATRLIEDAVNFAAARKQFGQPNIQHLSL